MKTATGLQLTTSQRLAITPALQQSLATLQLPTNELKEAVEHEVDANPLLNLEDGDYDPLEDKTEEAAAPAATPFDEPAGSMPLEREASLLTWSQTPAHEDETAPVERLAAQETLSEHLRRQLAGLRLTPQETERLIWLIGSLDENGFLTEPLTECVQGCPAGGDMEDWNAALKLLQSFDPAGVGAANVMQALVLQVRDRAFEKEIEPAAAQLAEQILTQCTTELARRDFKSIAARLGCSVKEASAAYTLISSLNPRPAANYLTSSSSGCIIPEVLVTKQGAHWVARINPQVVPQLRFNHEYFELLTQAKLDPEQRALWKDKAHSAKSFLHAVELRFSTIASVAQTIVDAQERFFEEGPQALFPMVLRDIAEKLGVAESTVSRATAGKYMQTPRGTYELKFFFSSAVGGAQGALVSSTAVRKRIRELVAAEDPKHPLSDSAITAQLDKEGVQLARRTVAKYREMEGIAPKFLRKGLPAKTN